MPMTGTMVPAMALTRAAWASLSMGWCPAGPPSGDHTRAVGLRALDDDPLTAAHCKLLTVPGTALVIDVMEPASIGFLLAGMRDEYGLTSTQTAVLPLAALPLTTVGSLVWAP